jgi:hypothetical protein
MGGGKTTHPPRLAKASLLGVALGARLIVAQPEGFDSLRPPTFL